MKRLFLAVILTALVASIVSPMAVSASTPKGSRVTSFWCALSVGSGHGKLESLDMVRIVRDQYDDTAPSSADPELQGWIAGHHAAGCGKEADLFVKLRVSPTQFAWYLAVVDYVLNT